MYLIRSDAKAKTDTQASALADINIIRTRANAPIFTVLPDGKKILDMVIEEKWLACL